MAKEKLRRRGKMTEQDIQKAFEDLGIYNFPEYKNAEDFARNLTKEEPPREQKSSWSDTSGVPIETLLAAVNPGACHA